MEISLLQKLPNYGIRGEELYWISDYLFFIFNIKVYNNEFTYNTTYELLYDTTSTVPGGAIYHDYPLAFNINLRNTTKTKYTLKYKVLDINI